VWPRGEALMQPRHIQRAADRFRVRLVMVDVPEDLRYTRQHEWVRVEGARARIGITDFAQRELTDIVFVELPKVGRSVQRGEAVGAVESVKTVSEIYAPVAGEIVEVNQELDSHPDLLNKEPYGRGWLALLGGPRAIDTAGLLSPQEYRALIEKRSSGG